MKIVTKVSISKLRQVCIKNNYYTAGDCRAYNAMLTMFEGRPVNGDRIEILAKDIKEHSHTDDTVLEIAAEILHDATYRYITYDNED